MDWHWVLTVRVLRGAKMVTGRRTSRLAVRDGFLGRRLDEGGMAKKREELTA